MLSERIREMESDLERISGVGAARIRAEDGEISEIHIVADPARRPKFVVRDVVTTLYARHGIHVPHQRISVAGTADPSAAFAQARAPQPRARIRIAGMNLAREGDRWVATIELKDGDRSVQGSAERPGTRANRMRVIGEAALDAVRKLTGELITLDLQDVKRIRVGVFPVVLAHVVLLQSGGERSLFGSCPAGSGRLDAPAGAVLDAVNRVLRSFRPREEEIEYEVREDGDK